MQTKSVLFVSSLFASQVLGDTPTVVTDLTKFKDQKDCAGPIEITKAADVELIKTCEKISGVFTISGADAEYKVELPKLTEVTGLVIKGDKVTDVKLSELAKIEKEYTIKDATKLIKLDTPKLKDVGTIDFNGVKVADKYEAKDLKVGTKISFVNTDFTSLVGLKYVKNTGALTISKNAKLTEVKIEELADITEDFIINDNPLLKSVLIPTLKTITGSLKVDKNPELREIKFPALTSIKSVEIKSRYLNNLNLGTYTYQAKDTLEAPVECDKIKGIESFKKEECDKLVKALPKDNSNFGMSLQQSSISMLLAGAVAYLVL